MSLKSTEKPRTESKKDGKRLYGALVSCHLNRTKMCAVCGCSVRLSCITSYVSLSKIEIAQLASGFDLKRTKTAAEPHEATYHDKQTQKKTHLRDFHLPISSSWTRHHCCLMLPRSRFGGFFPRGFSARYYLRDFLPNEEYLQPPVTPVTGHAGYVSQTQLECTIRIRCSLIALKHL